MCMVGKVIRGGRDGKYISSLLTHLRQHCNCIFEAIVRKKMTNNKDMNLHLKSK